MDCWPVDRIIVVILLSVASVPALMGLGVLTWMLWNMLRGKGGWPS